MASQKNNIIKFRKWPKLTIDIVICALVALYVIYGLIAYLQTGRVIRYEVKEGSLAINNIYRGIALRNETVQTTNAAGYLNYFAYEGDRVAVGDLVYSIDESGKLNNYLENEELNSSSLSEKELREFRNEIVNFTHGFNPEHFSGVYEYKRSLKSTVLKIASSNLLKNIENLSGDGNSAASLNYSRAPKTGIIAYWTDGFETMKPGDVTEDVFDTKKYEKKQIVASELIAKGDPAYKISTDEEWCLVIPIEEERGKELVDEGYVKVKFLSNQYESWGKTSLLHNPDGKTYLQLDFNNSMVTFVSDRFMDVEIISHEEVGLKIPLSSIVEKEFFLIPKDYVVETGKNGKPEICRECYLEDGTISIETLETEIYSFDEKTNEYYLDSSFLSAGDKLHKMDGQTTYTVSKRATLIGVYNMNRGYADFKEIKILYQNDEYAIVKPNTRYGLNVYDYIVLDAASVRDDQFINE